MPGWSASSQEADANQAVAVAAPSRRSLGPAGACVGGTRPLPFPPTAGTVSTTRFLRAECHAQAGFGNLQVFVDIGKELMLLLYGGGVLPALALAVSRQHSLTADQNPSATQ